MGAGSVVLNQPGVYLVDVDGNAITVTDGLAIGSAEAMIVAGKDGVNARFVRVAADGTVRIDPTGTTTQPVSAASLPLPAGAATEATLATRLSKADFEARINTFGQKPMSGSTPVVMASDQAPVPVTFTPANSRTGVSHSFLTLGGGTANSLNVMRATAYTEPTSAAQRSVGSVNANDAAAGTGARTILILYYDGTGAGPFSETITLNGTTPVNTVATDIQFIEKIEVLTAGSGGANVGTISLYGSTGGAGGTIGTIGVGNTVSGVGDNQTLWAHHYIAAGYTAEVSVLITSVQSGGSPTSGRFFVRYKHPLVASSVELVIGGILLVQGAFERSYDFNPSVDGFARIAAYGIPAVNNAVLSAAFDWSETVT